MSGVGRRIVIAKYVVSLFLFLFFFSINDGGKHQEGDGHVQVPLSIKR